MSTQRSLQIAKPFDSSEPQADVQPGHASTLRIRTFILLAASFSTELVIMLDDDAVTSLQSHLIFVSERD